MDASPEPSTHAPWEERLAVACMALLAVITLLNVLTRYFSNQDFAWTEEISIFLMVVMTLAGASAAAARDRHIRIEFFLERGSAERRGRIAAWCAGFSALVFAALAWLFARVVADEIRYAETSMGLGVPRWWYTASAPVLCALVAWRSARVAWRGLRAAPDGTPR